MRPAALPSKKRLTDKERRTINRQNGKKSRGAKTPLGRSRSSQNALRHGLAVAISDDPAVSAAVEHLAARRRVDRAADDGLDVGEHAL